MVAPVQVDNANRRSGSAPAADYAARFMLAQYAAFRFRRDEPQFENAKRITGLDLSEATAFAHIASKDEWYARIFWEVVQKMNNTKAMTDVLNATQTLLFTLPDAAQCFGSLGASVFQTPFCDGSATGHSRYEIVDLGMFRCHCPACAIMSIDGGTPFSARPFTESVLHCVKCGTLIKCSKYYLIEKCGIACD